MSTPNPVPATALESAPPAASASAAPADSSYMLLIVEPLGQRQARGRTGGEQAYARMLAYGADLQARGLLTRERSRFPDDEMVVEANVGP